MKLNIFDQLSDGATRVVKKPDTPELSLQFTDRAATSFSWAAAFIALFARAAAVLISIFRRDRA